MLGKLSVAASRWCVALTRVLTSLVTIRVDLGSSLVSQSATLSSDDPQMSAAHWTAEMSKVPRGPARACIAPREVKYRSNGTRGWGGCVEYHCIALYGQAEGVQEMKSNCCASSSSNDKKIHDKQSPNKSHCLNGTACEQMFRARFVNSLILVVDRRVMGLEELYERCKSSSTSCNLKSRKAIEFMYFLPAPFTSRNCENIRNYIPLQIRMDYVKQPTILNNAHV